MPAAIISFLMCALCAPIFAATVVLNDGRCYDGKLVAEDAERVLFEIDGHSVQLPRTMIAEIRHDVSVRCQSSNATVVQGFAETVIAPAEPEIAVVDAEVPLYTSIDDPLEPDAPCRRNTAVVLPVPADAVVQMEIMETIDLLRMGEGAARREAREVLAALGDPGLAMLVAYGLYHELPSVRTESALLLGDLGGQRVIKYLLEAFYAAASPTLPPYQIDYIQALGAAIARATGRDFSFYVRGTGAPVAAQEMVLWWNENNSRLPPQLGEPEINGTECEYPVTVAVSRRLNLERRHFGGSNLPIDMVDGMVVNSPSEEFFVDTIPVLPFNEPLYLDRQTSTSYTPSVTKIPDESYSAPIEFRLDRYHERIVDRLRR